MTDKYAKLREAAEKATPGPWYEDGRTIFIDTRSQVCCGKGVEVGCPEGGSMLECCGTPTVEGDYGPVAEAGEQDAAYIAAANPQAVLALLDERDSFLAAVADPNQGLWRYWNDKAVECVTKLAAEKARADAAEARINEWSTATGELKRKIDDAEATISTLTAERDALKRERDEAREALKPFADAIENADRGAAQMGFAPSFDQYVRDWSFSYGDLRRARSALSDANAAERE